MVHPIQLLCIFLIKTSHLNYILQQKLQVKNVELYWRQTQLGHPLHRGPPRVTERVDIAIQLATLDWISILSWGIAPEGGIERE